MNDTFTKDNSRMSVRIAGWSLIVAAAGFMIVFSWLAANFGYPDVLDGDAAKVLPQLVALGTTGRAVWIVYALIPLLLIPAAFGASAAWRDMAPSAMRVAVIAGVVAAVSMLLGLARWPTIQWELANSYSTANADGRTVIDAVFRGLNVYLGNFIGEFLGELALSAFFISAAYGMRRSGAPKLLAYAGYLVGVTGLIAALRNVTSIVAPIADLNNYLLPVWLIILGVVLVRWKR